MMRFAPSLASLLLCGSVLAGCASDNSGVLGNIGQHKNVSASTGSGALPTDVDSGVRQAQQARLAGRYDDAIHTLSQLMLLASDDPRVVGEYGKALVEKGRAREAVQFLTRATELQPRDWTVYSALGVAYDEAGDQVSAGRAYEHALALKPGEPAILNNYALSRMLASDPAMARQLIASAASAGGASDPKIAHNIALVNSLAALAPTPVAQAPQPPQSLAAKAPAVDVASRAPIATPAALPAVPAASNPQVVMQSVPIDPLAGPVKSRAKPLAKPVTPDDKTAKAADAKSAAPKTAIPDLRQAALNY
jgi:Flp pilus assembly protein TadD